MNDPYHQQTKPRFYLYRTKDKDGKFHPTWRFRYLNYDGRWRYGSVSPNKTETKQVARELALKAFKIHLGLLPLPETMPQEQFQPLETLFEEFQQWGDSQGGRGGRPWSPVHSKKNRRSLKRIQELLHWKTIRDINLRDVDKLVRCLKTSGMRRGKELSPRTVAQFIERLKTFVTWAVKRGYLKVNPLEGIGKLDKSTQMKRRSLSWEEVGNLLCTAPEKRSLLYRVAIETGLRAGELNSLKVEDFDPEHSMLMLRGENAKDRNDAEIFLSKGLCDLLSKSIEGMKPIDRLLPGLIFPEQSRYIYKDFKTAGIEKDTRHGRADFHALRKTHINLVLQGGADVKTTQALARHKTPDLTMNLYGEAQEERMRKAVEELGERISQSTTK